jgi:hypothetical protein
MKTESGRPVIALGGWMLKCPFFYFTETFSGHSSLFAASLATVRRSIKAQHRSDARGCCEQPLARRRRKTAAEGNAG